jgi:CRP-like cAMP-binding protein
MTPQELLRQHVFLGALTERDASALLKRAITKRVAKNAVVVRKGQPGDGLYGILTGSVFIVADSADGKELILNRQEPGEFFGEIALLDNAGRSATVKAAENATLLFLGRNDLLAFLRDRPEVMLRIVGMLCSKLRRATGVIEDMAFLNVSARLAKRIVGSIASGAAGQHRGAASTLRTSQADLARMLGVSREFVNKQLVTWREAGIIELGHRCVVVRDRAALEQLAGL